MKLDPVEGLNQGLSDFSDSATNVMENVKNVTANALNNMSDSLADFVLTGKGSFKDFANAVISDITRMVMKMLVFRPIEAEPAFMGAELLAVVMLVEDQEGFCVADIRDMAESLSQKVLFMVVSLSSQRSDSS